MAVSMHIAIVCDMTSRGLAENTDASQEHAVSIFGLEGSSGQKCFQNRRKK
jgi:hypothetical protein